MDNFYTGTIKAAPLFESVKRVETLDLLEPETRACVRAIMADASAHGMELMVFETYRSTARQVDLFNHGASKLKAVGVHHYGLACDLVKVVNGEPSWKGDFSLLGVLARAHGLIWGGDWGAPGVKHSFVDAVHVQRCSLADQAALFREEWYPDDQYDPYKTNNGVA